MAKLAIDELPMSAELAADLDRLESLERSGRDRQREAEVARLRDVARFD